jgi:hypothetical protein
VLQFTPGFDGNSSITKWMVQVKHDHLCSLKLILLCDVYNLKMLCLWCKENKAVPATGCGGNWLTDGSKVVSPVHWQCSTPQEHYFSYSGVHFC